MSRPGQRVPIAVPPPGPEKAVGRRRCSPSSRSTPRPSAATGGTSPSGWTTAPSSCGTRPSAGPCGRSPATRRPSCRSPSAPTASTSLSGSADATAILWDVETGAPLRTYKGHTGAVVSVAFSPDGTRLLTGSADGTAILWDTQTGERVHTLKLEGNPGRRVQPGRHHPGHGLGGPHRDAVGRRDRQAERSCCGATGRTSTASPSARTAGASSPGRPTTSASSGTWPPASRIIRTGRHGNNVHSVAFTPDGRRVISGEREELVMMWDAATGDDTSATFVGHSGGDPLDRPQPRRADHADRLARRHGAALGPGHRPRAARR